MRIARILVLVTVASAACTTIASAQSAAGQDGPQSDPRGAIHALGRVGGRRHVEQGVKIPQFVGHIAHAADQLPPGTTPPGSGPTYIAPR